jgi:oxygen-dependent protoporphyrinogen oxidase
MTKVLFVGAGISGLALAYRFHQLAPAAEITILEARDRPGGTLWTEQHDGFQVEIGPNGFLDTKPATITLCRDLGLGNQLLPASEGAGRNRYLFLNSKLHRLPDSLGSFLRSGLLSWRGKLGILTERLRAPRGDHAEESIDAFVRRRAGCEAAEILADALVTGIHAGDPALLSVQASFPRLTSLEAEFGSVLKGMGQMARRRRAEAKARGQATAPTGRMWSFRPGLRLVVERLCACLPQPPVLGVAVQRIAWNSHRQPAWTVSAEGQDRWTADAVVLTCPAHQQAALLADLDPELSQQINSIVYNRVAVVALGYRRGDVPGDLDGFGYIAPQRTRRDVLGVQWCSAIFPDRAPPGYVLLRAMCGGWNRPEMVGWEDGQLLRAVRAELHLAMSITAEPVFQRIIRWERAIPQYHLGHPERVARILQRAARYPGLILGGNTYHGIALNDCTEQADRLARQLQGFLATGFFTDSSFPRSFGL